jgi:hypothetical protein
MADEGSGLFQVDSALVRDTMVEAIHEKVEARRKEGPPERILSVLEAEGGPTTGCEDPKLDKGLRHAGYFTRVVEVEMFEPARHTAEWIPEMLNERLAEAGDWSRAVTEACVDLADSEPLGKPRPDDERARTWRIPGPGGHVRHYASSRAIGEELGRINAISEIGDPSELKRLWLYGFFVRACEEAVPPEAEEPADGESSPAEAEGPAGGEPAPAEAEEPAGGE